MQLPKEKKISKDKVQEIIKQENEFIKGFFSVLSLPNRPAEQDEFLTNNEEKSFKFQKHSNKPRAQTLSELQERLESVGKKKKLTYKEKLSKKSLKNRMKKKTKRDERNAAKKLLKAQQITNENVKKEEESASSETTKPTKPVFNSEGKMVFSKIDFSNVGVKKVKKVEKDPKKLLKDLEKQKEIVEELVEAGDIGKAVEIKEKSAWKNALAKTEGQKVKDDPVLLKKTLQKQEQKKRSSKKKWESRQKGVEKAMAERQKKRTDNIQKRKKEKKVNKLKKASKKGKIIPGF